MGGCKPRKGASKGGFIFCRPKGGFDGILRLSGGEDRRARGWDVNGRVWEKSRQTPIRVVSVLFRESAKKNRVKN